MWNKIATFRENLSQMASDVLDTVEELESETPRGEDGDSGTSTSSPLYNSRSQRRPGDSFQSSRRPRRLHEERNGSTSHDESEQELMKQIQSKELAYRALDENYQHALREVEKLQSELHAVQLDLAARNSKPGELEYVQGVEATTSTTTEAESQTLQDENPNEATQELQKRDDIILQLRESLEHERIQFQAEKKLLKSALESRELELQQASSKSPDSTIEAEMLKAQAREVDILLEKMRTSELGFESEKAELKLKLEAITVEKEKAINNLNRLKQHLLEKENADSEKMDQDSEQIAALEARAAASTARVLQLEQALSKALATHAETSKRVDEELRASKLEIESLNLKVSTLYSTLEAKDNEIANLQVALGQYYAESEAKERLQRELESSRGELRKLSVELEVAKRTIDAREAEKHEAVEKMRLEERKGLESQRKAQKLQEDMFRLRRALEESMVRLNRMSSDSDFSVDRRIVIKLLVTYFERGHNREVLDLMARMLGFTEDDKRRVGLAHQNAGKPGVVRSVLGLPGRVVGGLLGGGTSEGPGFANNQSFADLWIDFLLKESEKVKEEEALVAAGNPASSPKGAAELENGFDSSDDVGFGADNSFPSSASTSSLDTAIRSGHRRVYSRP